MQHGVGSTGDVRSRRRKTAMERRQQRARAEARGLARLLRGFRSIDGHRGCQLSRVGARVLEALQAEARQPAQSWGEERSAPDAADSESVPSDEPTATMEEVREAGLAEAAVGTLREAIGHGNAERARTALSAAIAASLSEGGSPALSTAIAEGLSEVAALEEKARKEEAASLAAKEAAELEEKTRKAAADSLAARATKRAGIVATVAAARRQQLSSAEAELEELRVVQANATAAAAAAAEAVEAVVREGRPAASAAATSTAVVKEKGKGKRP